MTFRDRLGRLTDHIPGQERPWLREPVGIATALEGLFAHGMPFTLTAFDGSAAGDPDASIRLHLANERGLAYLLTAPGDLGYARAYVSGDLQAEGFHPGDPYDAMTLVLSRLSLRRPSPSEALQLLRSVGITRLVPPPPPPQETLPPWRRILEGARHSRHRDAEAIHHHYDVSNRF